MYNNSFPFNLVVRLPLIEILIVLEFDNSGIDLKNCIFNLSLSKYNKGEIQSSCKMDKLLFEIIFCKNVSFTWKFL